MRKIFAAGLLTFLLNAGASFGQQQYAQALTELEEKHQTCLDNEPDVMNCSKTYYKQVDSLLNVVYKSIKTNMSAEQKEGLKEAQMLWLKKRDAYFLTVPKEAKEEAEDLSPAYVAAITWEKKAQFVSDRIIELLSLEPAEIKEEAGE